ncbi:unnamed protein product [Blepharisma stoltei]|uniref:Uncharacterized protein n=1 Tax=Blepharisma stoltei TaxID=1481888 RepID=A0AAU9I8D1_9CILI|nr:unnamed protein product [Blepharisma stoltei]
MNDKEKYDIYLREYKWLTTNREADPPITFEEFKERYNCDFVKALVELIERERKKEIKKKGFSSWPI